ALVLLLQLLEGGDAGAEVVEFGLQGIVVHKAWIRRTTRGRSLSQPPALALQTQRPRRTVTPAAWRSAPAAGTARPAPGEYKPARTKSPRTNCGRAASRRTPAPTGCDTATRTRPGPARTGFPTRRPRERRCNSSAPGPPAGPGRV